MLQRLADAFLAHDVVSGNMGVAGIDARADRNDAVEPIQNLRNLLEASAKRELRPGGVLDQDRQAPPPDRALAWTPRSPPRSGAVPAPDRLRETNRDAAPDSPRTSASARSTSPRNASSTSSGTVRFVARQIHEIVRMNHQRLQVVSRAQPVHLGALRSPSSFGAHCRGLEEKICNVLQPSRRPLSRILERRRRRCMNADPTRSQARRLFRSGRLRECRVRERRADHEAKV